MRNGPCPKCGSKEIYVSRYGDSYRNELRLGWWRSDVLLVKEYICAECGFIESYLADMSNISKVMEKCEKA